MSDHFLILAFIPILILFIISLWKGVTAGVITGFVVTTILFFLWGNSVLQYFAATLSALVGTINILMIIFGAVFLYNVMEQKGYINGIMDSLLTIHPERNFRFFFLAFFLTAFFESVAGFGTPGAIVPLLLISMGYAPVPAIAIVLLIDGMFAVTGAVGTPVTAGLEAPLRLSADSVSKIYLYAGAGLFISGIAIMFFVSRYHAKFSGWGRSNTGWLLFFVIMVPFVLISRFAGELTGLLASVVMALFAYVFLFRNRQIQWKAWVPYWLLIVLLLLPKIFPWFASMLAFKLEFNAIMGTDVSAALQPFRSPLIPFLGASLYALFRAKDFTVDLKPILSRTFTVFLVLFPSLAITQLMLNSASEFPSMIDQIASVFVRSGDFYPVFSPLIGVLGAFISGSTTVSNIIFGSAQSAAAQSLDMQIEIILSLQLIGASLGNAICLFNIIAAAAVAGVKDYNKILKLNLLPVIVASLVCTGLGYVLLWML